MDVRVCYQVRLFSDALVTVLSLLGGIDPGGQTSLSAHHSPAKTLNTKLHTEEGQRGAF